MSTKKTASKPLECAECGEPLDRFSVHAGCHDCPGDADPEPDDSITAGAIREWAASEKAFGRLTPELASALERCADDIEAGWPHR